MRPRVACAEVGRAALRRARGRARAATSRTPSAQAPTGAARAGRRRCCGSCGPAVGDARAAPRLVGLAGLGDLVELLLELLLVRLVLARPPASVGESAVGHLGLGPSVVWASSGLGRRRGRRGGRGFGLGCGRGARVGRGCRRGRWRRGGVGRTAPTFRRRSPAAAARARGPRPGRPRAAAPRARWRRRSASGMSATGISGVCPPPFWAISGSGRVEDARAEDRHEQQACASSREFNTRGATPALGRKRALCALPEAEAHGALLQVRAPQELDPRGHDVAALAQPGRVHRHAVAPAPVGRRDGLRACVRRA